MLSSATSFSPQSIVSLKDYIAEQAPEKPYRFVVIYNDPENMTDDSKAEAEEMAVNMLKYGSKLGLKGFKCRIEDSYLSRKDGKLYIHDIDDKSFLIDENTIVFNRSKSNDFANWQGMMYDLEKSNVVVINSLDVHLLCADKWKTYVSLELVGAKQPKTLLVNSPEKCQGVFERLDTKFPVVLKTQLGTGGVGVVKIENETQLLATTQLIHRLNQERGMILQEFIPLEYDIRVIVLAGEIHGAMKRPVPSGDFRSNVHQGSEPEKIVLTEMEKMEIDITMKAMQPRGSWIGIDLIPAKDREKERPYVLEVNTQPGTVGYNSIIKGDILEDVLKKFMNRDNWT
jgi:RimK family alpha-L-glutamate ligase